MGRVAIISRDLLMSQFHLSVLTPDTGQIINHSESNFSSLLKNYSSLERFIPSRIIWKILYFPYLWHLVVVFIELGKGYP